MSVNIIALVACCRKGPKTRRASLRVPGWLGWFTCPILDFDSGHDLPVCGIEPHIGLYADSVDLTWGPLSAPPLLMLFLSLKINK